MVLLTLEPQGRLLMMKTFDCVELQRKLRSDLVREADYNVDKFFDLIDERKKTSLIYKKLTKRLEKQEQIIK